MPILPSLDRQLASAREASSTEFAVTHIDTCLSCYLTDHHNRDGELLLGVYVDGSTTVEAVLDGLRDEFRQFSDLAEDRRGFDYDKALAAIEAVREENKENADELFDSSLEVPSDQDFDGGDYVQAWFLIHWDVPEEEE